ncbi:hypothetical protein JTE90_000914 [Oedothorax gibbosus]|uniref:Secreted protein n=1 Tax=Oedothorax gibbosus TaxID=931172 RepID=A0AAV6VWH5_9ARAC|nr:hypothetical protein JTE90_000914 [Oedothorax gibbosus]
MLTSPSLSLWVSFCPWAFVALAKPPEIPLTSPYIYGWRKKMSYPIGLTIHWIHRDPTSGFGGIVSLPPYIPIHASGIGHPAKHTPLLHQLRTFAGALAIGRPCPWGGAVPEPPFLTLTRVSLIPRS